MTSTTQRASCWALTINNPTDADEICIATAKQKGWKVDGQTERGENGTFHYQLMLRTPQVRFSAVKRAFPRAHIEVARNVAALASYVTKSATRVGTLPSASDMYPNLTAYWQLVYDYCESKNYLNHNEWLTELDHSDQLWWKEAPRDKNSILDEATRDIIKKGYFVESLAVNPATRAMWFRFKNQIMARCEQRSIRRQSDSQSYASESEKTDSVDVTQQDDSPRAFGFGRDCQDQEALLPTWEGDNSDDQ